MAAQETTADLLISELKTKEQFVFSFYLIKTHTFISPSLLTNAAALHVM